MHLKVMTVAILVLIMGFSSLLIVEPDIDLEAKAEPTRGRNLYVDDSGGSTYTYILGALNDAADGDTIYVAPGQYSLFSAYDLENVTIIGNATQGEVKVIGSVEFIPLYLKRCANISISGFSFNGSGMAAELDECSNIAFGLNQFTSQSDYYHKTIVIRDSDEIQLGWCTITTTARDSWGIDLISTDDFYASSISVSLPGDNMGVLRASDSSDTILYKVSAIYTGDLIDATSSSIRIIDTEVPDEDVVVDGNSLIDVEFHRRVVVKEEDNFTRLEGAEIEFRRDDILAYYTPHYGGSNGVSTVDGIFVGLPNMINKRFIRSSIPAYVNNSLKFYHDGLDQPAEIILFNATSDTSDELHVIFPDMRAPEPPQNVTGEAVDHDTIEIFFDPSPSEDVVLYEIQLKSGEDWIEVLNTTDPGDHFIHDLEENTTYNFRVRSVDDAGIGSIWINATNTTEVGTEGILNGTLTYVGGPLNGTVAVNVSMILSHLDINGLFTQTTDMNGSFHFKDMPFLSGYTLTYSPPNYTEIGSIIDGYVNGSVTIDLIEDTELDIEVDHYDYVKPKSGSLSGTVTYLNGPKEGENATNTLIILYNEDGEEVANFTINETGFYHFSEIPFGGDYRIHVIPENEYSYEDGVSGYRRYNLSFDLIENKEMNLSVAYLEYIPPTYGQISGTVTYDQGPKHGEPAEGAFIEILNSNGTVIKSGTTDEYGKYHLEVVPFGTGYSIRVKAFIHDEGEEGVKSGYLRQTGWEFDYETEDLIQNLILIYYEYVEPDHPSVHIVDEDGEPVQDALVIVTINGTSYNATTDEYGVAIFSNINGTGFPEGSEFKATKDGFDDLEWTQGSEVPQMVEEDEDKSSDTVLFFLIFVIVIILAIVIFLILRRSIDIEEE